MSDNGAFDQESLAEKAMDALSKEIFSGRLAPGQRVDLAAYAEKWKISVTPIRDAAKHLESIGLLKVLARRGVFVAEINLKDLKDIFDVRIALECAAIRLATPRIPDREARRALELYQSAKEQRTAAERARLLPKIDALIHDLAHEHCGNPRLQKIMNGIRYLIKWSQSTIIVNMQEPFSKTLPEHIAICQAVCARDPERAVNAMQVHLQNTYERLEVLIRAKTEGGITADRAADDRKFRPDVSKRTARKAKAA